MDKTAAFSLFECVRVGNPVPLLSQLRLRHAAVM